MIDYFLLILGFFFTFFLPGFVLIETFFQNLPSFLKFPAIFVLSVIISTYLVYFFSLFLGFSRFSILLVFSLILIWFLILLFRSKKPLSFFPKEHKEALIFAALVFLVYFVALYPAIFKEYQGYIVMSGPNWQDTALHLGIIQSLTQGNFPPQAPYFAGRPLHYYYFVNFHSAILAKLFGKFFPRILVYDNPFFPAIFSLSVYSLCFFLTKRKKISLFSSFVSTFFSNLYFTKFLVELFHNKQQTSLIERAFFLLKNNSYSLEFERIFQMANMADYFLQNRGMMVALPAVVIGFAILLYGFSKKDLSVVFLSGIISASLFKFQIFGFFVSFLLFQVALIFYFQRDDLKFYLRSFIVFCLLFSAFFLILKVPDSPSFLVLAKDHLSFGPWEKEKDLSWHLKFIVGNLGPVFIFNIFAGFFALYNFFSKKPQNKEFLLLFCVSLILFFIPYFVSFTLYAGDMLKFLYFLIPFSSILSFWFVENLNLRFSIKTLFFLLFFLSTFSSFLTLTHSFLNKTGAYSLDDVKVGLWIRKNTPQRSVFITWLTVHSPVDQIGGRLRVVSYPFWPYSHGFIYGEDNVYERCKDIENFFKNSEHESLALEIMEKYGADYIFYGQEERANFPEAEENFEKNSQLEKVYDSNGIKIWKRVK